MKKILLGLVGEKGGGKESFALLLRKRLSERTMAHHRFSDPLREGLDILGLEQSRNNQQLLPQLLNNPRNQHCTPPTWVGVAANHIVYRHPESTFRTLLERFCIPDIPENIELLRRLIHDPTREDRGVWQHMTQEETEAVLASAVKKRALAGFAPIVVLDGMRWLTDEKMMRDLPHDIHGVIIYITASVDVRYGRLRARKERVGEAGMSREQFDHEETAQNEIFIPQIGSRADHTIVNETNDIQDLEREVEHFYRTKLQHLLKNAWVKEPRSTSGLFFNA